MTAIDNTPIQTEWANVTPTRAKELLALNTHNRNLRRVRSSRLARDMRKGSFAITHQGIAVSADGVLLDGQHRLAAIIESGEPQWVLITIGLPAEAQRYMDRGAVRNVHDFLDGKNAAIRVAAVRQLIAIRTLDGVVTTQDLEQTTRHLISDSDIYEFVEAEPGLMEDMLDLSNAARQASRFVPVGPSALLTAAITFPDVGEGSLETLRSGVGLEAGDPLLALRNYRNSIDGGISLEVYTMLRLFQAVQKGRRMMKMPVGRDMAAVRVPVR